MCLIERDLVDYCDAFFLPLSGTPSSVVFSYPVIVQEAGLYVSQNFTKSVVTETVGDLGLNMTIVSSLLSLFAAVWICSRQAKLVFDTFAFVMAQHFPNHKLLRLHFLH